ncbi:hypothetical protein ACTMTI_45960 [Nonomuraea sp. H19]|uniref:hypothetical protein n=1 Tax=Nonomuraea sp. H19 TaxID=3452206 RepID=UPI003F8AA0BA
MRLWRKVLAVVAGAVLVGEAGFATSASAGSIQSAGSAQLWVSTWGTDVNVRNSPTGGSAIWQIDAGNYPYTCTTAGDRATYGPYTNFYWSKINFDRDGDGYYESVGWISDIFIRGGVNDRPARDPYVLC